MSTVLYEVCRLLFPELKDTAAPEEPENFDQFAAWLNQKHHYLMKLDPLDVQDNGIAESYKLQQLKIDTDELLNQIHAELGTLHDMYEQPDVPAAEDDGKLHAYDFEFTSRVIFNEIKMFTAPYDLALLTTGLEQRYWMLAPDHPELLHKLVQAFNDCFEDAEPLRIAE